MDKDTSAVDAEYAARSWREGHRNGTYPACRINVIPV